MIVAQSWSLAISADMRRFEQIGLLDDGVAAEFLTGGSVFRVRFSKYLQEPEFEMLSHAELSSSLLFPACESDNLLS